MAHRRAMFGGVVATLALLAGCGGGEGPRKAVTAGSGAGRTPVPYVVAGGRATTTAQLWSDAERSAPKAGAKVPSGTKVKILERKELPRSRGGTMCRVRAVTGEEGWIPEKFIEFRDE